MLQVFFGTDETDVRTAALSFVRDKEKEHVTVTTIDSDVFIPGMLFDAVGATSLFGGETCYVIDTPQSNTEFMGEVQQNLDALQASKNTFVVIEGTLLSADKKKYTKYADTVLEFQKEKTERFNVFTLTDLLAQKNKKQLWLRLCDAKASGVTDEEIIGVLWWQLKSLRLAACTQSADEAGMKPFPYNKSKRVLSNFSAGELENLSHTLIALRHEGHLGVCDLDLALEKWVLTLQ